MSQSRTFAIILATVLFLYAGGYLALSDPMLGGMSMGGGTTSRMRPHYRVGEGVAERVFKPMELVDRTVRPDFWAEKHSSDVFYVYEDESTAGP
jgi:hypothetical protein